MAGKRILCCNRYGRSGCGRTRQLYLADVIPKRQCPLSTVAAFIQALLAGAFVEHAYLTAIQSTSKNARHAWRWLNAFFKSLSSWRIIASLSFRDELKQRPIFQQGSRRLNTLLPTLKLLSSRLSHFQHQYQQAFF